MGRFDDDLPRDDAEGLGGPPLLDALTAAAAAVDRAQVVGDIAAHRVVQVVANSADGNPPVISDIIGPPAVQVERVASEIADAAARYEQTRTNHASSLEDLAEAPEPEALSDLEDVVDDSARAEAEAHALIQRIDHAERRLQRRAAMPASSPIDLRPPPSDPASSPTPPRLH